MSETKENLILSQYQLDRPFAKVRDGKSLKKYAAQLQLTTFDIAKMTGVHCSTVRRWMALTLPMKESYLKLLNRLTSQDIAEQRQWPYRRKIFENVSRAETRQDLKFIRESKKYTQDQVGWVFNGTRHMISGVENGKTDFAAFRRNVNDMRSFYKKG